MTARLRRDRSRQNRNEWNDEAAAAARLRVRPAPFATGTSYFIFLFFSPLFVIPPRVRLETLSTELTSGWLCWCLLFKVMPDSSPPPQISFVLLFAAAPRVHRPIYYFWSGTGRSCRLWRDHNANYTEARHLETCWVISGMSAGCCKAEAATLRVDLLNRTFTSLLLFVAAREHAQRIESDFCVRTRPLLNNSVDLT